jgi:short-subunit dehydrogenase
MAGVKEGGFETAIVVGASSGIGAAVAQRLATVEGCRVALVARREDQLRALAAAIDRAAAPGRARPHVHDVRRGEEVPQLWDAIERELGQVDLLVYAAGVLSQVGENEYSFAKDKDTLEVNLVGAAAWFDEAALRMAARRRGTIVGVSSVAGDRGRRGNPAYAASKAGMTTMLESLRNRLSGQGVTVCTVRPGFVATPMTAAMDLPPRMTVTAERAAELIVAAAKKKRGVDVYVPLRWAFVMYAIRHVPSFVFRKLPI